MAEKNISLIIVRTRTYVYTRTHATPSGDDAHDLTRRTVVADSARITDRGRLSVGGVVCKSLVRAGITYISIGVLPLHNARIIIM